MINNCSDHFSISFYLFSRLVQAHCHYLLLDFFLFYCFKKEKKIKCVLCEAMPIKPLYPLHCCRLTTSNIQKDTIYRLHFLYVTSYVFFILNAFRHLDRGICPGTAQTTSRTKLAGKQEYFKSDFLPSGINYLTFVLTATIKLNYPLGLYMCGSRHVFIAVEDK